MMTEAELALLIPVATLDKLTTDEVSRWFNEQRAAGLKAQMDGSSQYCEARACGDGPAMERALERVYRGWKAVQELNVTHRAYNDLRRAKGIHRPAASAAQGWNLDMQRAATQKQREAADRQLASRGSVVKIDTCDQERRLKEKRWREMTRR